LSRLILHLFSQEVEGAKNAAQPCSIKQQDGEDGEMMLVCLLIILEQPSFSTDHCGTGDDQMNCLMIQE
jgi:hypothetical protein